MITEEKLKRIEKIRNFLERSLESCSICPRRCRVDRTRGKAGYCRALKDPAVYSYAPHHGEEPPLSGKAGSGTIFFAHCNMKCAYCQNYYFSQLDNGQDVSIESLAGMMLSLRDQGCHNVNLVSPTHYVPQIVLALEIALKKGLDIPVVYNTGGYDLVNTIKLLDGIIDIYMPDMRYSDDKMAKWYSDAPGYVRHNRETVVEMQSQVGDLVLDDKGVALKGLIIRLLVLPRDISGTGETLSFIKERVSRKAYLSIMSQYYPTYMAHDHEEVSRTVTGKEYQNIVDEARLLGLNNGWIQEAPSEDDGRFRGTNIVPGEDIG